MDLTIALDELTEAELLDHADEVSRMQRECEAQVLRIAVQHAILNNLETLDAVVTRWPGRERARRFSGVGTPDVAEFAAAASGRTARHLHGADRHRQAVHLMTPADTFPWGASTARTQQVDHTRPFREGGPPGQSRVGNYGPMTTFHHRIKTHDDWQVRQPFPGLYVWRDPHGATYVVDHSGTRRVPSMEESTPSKHGSAGRPSSWRPSEAGSPST